MTEVPNAKGSRGSSMTLENYYEEVYEKARDEYNSQGDLVKIARFIDNILSRAMKSTEMGSVSTVPGAATTVDLPITPGDLLPKGDPSRPVNLEMESVSIQTSTPVTRQLRIRVSSLLRQRSIHALRRNSRGIRWWRSLPSVPMRREAS